MCWIPLLLGALMTAGGAFLILRFFAGRGRERPDIATTRRTESMIVGVILTSLGFLVLLLGVFGVMTGCFGLG
jgi:hypothetical protein